MGFLLLVLKFLSIFVAGLLGIVAILFDFSLTAKKTKSAYLIIAGILVASLTSATITYLEARQGEKETTLLMSRIDNVLLQLERSNAPIEELQLTYWLELPKSDPNVVQFIKNINGFLADNRTVLTDSDFRNDPKHISVSSEFENEILSISIEPEAGIVPKAFKNETGLLPLFRMNLDIRKEKVSEDEYFPMHSVGKGYSDLTATDAMLTESKVRETFSFDLKEQKLSYFGRSSYDKRFWLANGEIISQVDLSGSQLILTSSIPNNLIKSLPEEQVEDIARDYKMGTVFLDLGRGQRIKIPDGKFDTWYIYRGKLKVRGQDLYIRHLNFSTILP